jgi:hypothetical protein
MKSAKIKNGRRRARSTGEVFLSHSSRDRHFVKRLAGTLRQYKMRYWYSTAHIVGAEQWHDAIGRALARCDWFVIILSPDAVSSTWVKRELLFALSHNRYNGRIIPLLLRPCQYSRLSWTLDAFQFVDFTKGTEIGWQQLLRIWRLQHKHQRKNRRAS